MIEITNKAGRVKLDDTVDEYSRKKLMEEIGKTFGEAALTNSAFAEIVALADAKQADTLTIEINSPGGSVFDGYLIYNELLAMRGRGVRVTAEINVLAASMGSVIAMAADEIKIAPNGRMMIHDASLFTGGTARHLAKMAEVLENISAQIAGIYANRTGQTAEACRAMMLEETWMDADKCIALGFADGLLDFGDKKNMITGMSFLDRLTKPSTDEALALIAAHESTIADRDAAVATMSAKITDLEARLQSAITEKAMLSESLATAQAEINQATAQLAAAKDDLTAAETAIAGLKAEADEAAAKHAEAITAANDSAAKRAVEIAATAGLEKPLTIDPSPAEAKTITRAQLSAMKPFEVSAFFKSGGKLTD